MNILRGFFSRKFSSFADPNLVFHIKTFQQSIRTIRNRANLNNSHFRFFLLLSSPKISIVNCVRCAQDGVDS